MKFVFCNLFFVLIGLFPMVAFAQHTNYPPAVEILEGNVYYSDSKKPANKVWLKISWGDSSRIIPCDSQGRLDEGGFFYHTSPDSIKIECATTDYTVTKFKVKTYESTTVLDAKGQKTSERWYLVMITVYVEKNKE